MDEKAAILWMMQNPLRWPLWPFLPVRKREGEGDGGLSTHGIMRTLSNGDPAQPVVAVLSEMELDDLTGEERIEVWDAASKFFYGALDEVVADGWEPQSHS